MERRFDGVIGDDWRTSTPWWPPEAEPPDGAPNVLLLVLDDVGFAQLGCYGSDLATPTLDRLAYGGVRLTNFHTTALCSPTRACLLTGRNHHRNGMGRIADLALGYPGYTGRIPRENGFLSEILRARGYASYAVGKWHLTPDDETHMAASRASWPLSRGFDRWYGFHGGETHQFVPVLYADNHSVGPRAYGDGYHLSADLADRAAEFLGDLRAVDADRPFFLYFATGACHSPHHAPPEWIARYRGHFDAGWDAWRAATFERQLAAGIVPDGTALAPRPPWVPAWEDLDDDARAVSARFMECFAGFLSYTDAQIARLLAFLEQTGDLERTLVVAVSDNGASAEGGVRGSINDARLWNGAPAGPRELRGRIDEIGGPSAHNNYPWGWTMAGNTPFKRWKREVHEGGVADPCIVWWPSRVPGEGGIRRQFAHAIDVLPTILELAGVEAPATIDGVAQSRIDGTSLAYALDDAAAPERHTRQYFEMLGSRAIYDRGWKAVAFHPIAPLYDDGLDPDAPFEDDVWELYDVTKDPAETRDLAADRPEKLRELVALWWEEARRNDVLPLDNRPLAALMNPRPHAGASRTRFVYYAHGAPVPEPVAVNVRNRSHAISTRIDAAAGQAANGVVLALGTVLGGFSLHFRDGVLRYVHNLYGKRRHVIAAGEPIEPGAHDIAFVFTKTGEFAGRGELRIDGRAVADGEIPHFTPVRFSITGAGLTCGYEQGPAVGDDYAAPFRANFGIAPVVVEVSGAAYRDPVGELEAIMSEQ
jgi:arylsulfatase